VNGTGYYSFENHSDGLRCYSRKAEAIRGAINSYWEKHETPTVYSPTGRIVWREIGANRVYTNQGER
jgi:hypothetical protein